MHNIQVFVFCNILCISILIVSLSLRLSNRKLKSVRQLYYKFTFYKNCRAFWDLHTVAGQFRSLKQLSLLSLPPYKPRVCHVAVTDSVNYHALRRVLRRMWFISSVVKIVYIFQNSKWGEVNSDKQAHWDHTCKQAHWNHTCKQTHWDHTCLLLSDFKKENGLKPDWYPP